MATNPKLHESGHMRSKKRYCQKCGDPVRRHKGGASAVHSFCRTRSIGQTTGKGKKRAQVKKVER